MVTCEEEVQQIGRKLEKIIAGKKEMGEAIELIEALANLPITLEVLTKTRIGMVINDLRKKTSDEQLSKKAKLLIRNWKSLFDDKTNKGSSSSSTTTTSSSTIAMKKVSQTSSKSKSASVEPPDNNSTAADNRTISTDKTIINKNTTTTTTMPNTSFKMEVSRDEVRQKSVEMIRNALTFQELPDGTLNPEELALRIENKLYEVHRGTTDKYKSALRSRVFNLRDKKNLELRENVLTGAVKPEQFAIMTVDEMASNEMKKKRKEFTKESILEHQMAIQEGTPSDMFRCGKCGKNNCTYNQMQTRSADEPMTTFVFCRVCGNRWKFC